MEGRIPPSCPPAISQILHHAWHHDLAGLGPLLQVPGRASVQEPSTGETPLHAAIRACGPAGASDDDDDAAAAAVVRELFTSGAIWNDVDSNRETPGCVAARLGRPALYGLCVDAGVRAELLFGLLDGYEELESESESEDGAGPGSADEDGMEVDEPSQILEADPDRAFAPPPPPPQDPDAADPSVHSDAFLRSRLEYSDGKLVDSSRNGVMMAWETAIMRASVAALLPPDRAAGRRILNVGFGMGIIDAMFCETRPSRHHIVEAHAEVLDHARGPDSPLGAGWEKRGPSEGAYRLWNGRWQDVVPTLLERGETYDAIYFDTFGEDYSQLRTFFTEYVPGLLDEKGLFSFFNGLGADRKICYDVYAKVVEVHLSDAGLDVEWQELDVDMRGLNKDGEDKWEGVKRRYWTLDSESLPTKCLSISIPSNK